MRFTLAGQSFELTADIVRRKLAGRVPESIQEYWVEVDGVRWPVKQVMAVATGLDRRRFQVPTTRAADCGAHAGTTRLNRREVNRMAVDNQPDETAAFETSVAETIEVEEAAALERRLQAQRRQHERAAHDGRREEVVNRTR